MYFYTYMRIMTLFRKNARTDSAIIDTHRGEVTRNVLQE